MTTLRENPAPEIIRSFRANLERRHPRAAAELGEALRGKPPDEPCWLELDTRAAPARTTGRMEPSGPGAYEGNDATRAIYQAWQEAVRGDGADHQLVMSMLGRLLVETVRQEAALGVETPAGIMDPESWRETAELLRDAVLQYLDVHAFWAGEALEYRNQPDLGYALWRAKRMPALLRENSLRGGPASPEFMAWTQDGYDDSREVTTWFNGRRYEETAERRAGRLVTAFCQHMARVQPRVGWNIEWYFQMAQARDLVFQLEFQKFVRENLAGGTGRINPEDAVRLARRIVGDALTPGGDSYTWNIVCILDGEDEDSVKRRMELVLALLGPAPDDLKPAKR